MPEYALLMQDGSFLNISQARFKEWEETFPGLDVKEEIEKANVWLAEPRNKGKQWKTLLGFEKWLKRGYENSPKIKATEKVKGQLGYRDRIHSEQIRREQEAAKVPRPPVELVERACRLLRESLALVPAPERTVEVPDPLRCKHEWAHAHYTNTTWCPKCGLYPDQWTLTLEHGWPEELARVLLEDAADKYRHRGWNE